MLVLNVAIGKHAQLIDLDNDRRDLGKVHVIDIKGSRAYLGFEMPSGILVLRHKLAEHDREQRDAQQREQRGQQVNHVQQHIVAAQAAEEAEWAAWAEQQD